MSHKIYTRQVKIPRRNRPITAKQLKKEVVRQLQQGEELIRVALTSVEIDHLVVEIGIQKQA